MTRKQYLDRLARLKKRCRNHHGYTLPIMREVYDDEIEPGEPLSDAEAERFFANGGRIKEILVHLGPRPLPCEPEDGKPTNY